MPERQEATKSARVNQASACVFSRANAMHQLSAHAMRRAAKGTVAHAFARSRDDACGKAAIAPRIPKAIRLSALATEARAPTCTNTSERAKENIVPGDQTARPYSTIATASPAAQNSETGQTPAERASLFACNDDPLPRLWCNAVLRASSCPACCCTSNALIVTRAPPTQSPRFCSAREVAYMNRKASPPFQAKTCR